MVGIIFMPVPYIIDGTTSHLHGLASYYHSTVHFNPSQSNKSSMCYNYYPYSIPHLTHSHANLYHPYTNTPSYHETPPDYSTSLLFTLPTPSHQLHYLTLHTHHPTPTYPVQINPYLYLLPIPNH